MRCISCKIKIKKSRRVAKSGGLGKCIGKRVRLRLFWLQRIFGNAFTPTCMFGRYWKLGQTELVFRVDCKIRHFGRKTILDFILPSNELHSSHTRTDLISTPAHTPTSTPHTVWRQASAAQPSQGQPRSCCPHRRPLCPDHGAPLRSYQDRTAFTPT